MHSRNKTAQTSKANASKMQRRKSDANRQHRQRFCYAKRKIGSKTSNHCLHGKIFAQIKTQLQSKTPLAEGLEKPTHCAAFGRLLLFVVFAVVGRFAIVTRRHGYLRKLATTATVLRVVMFANANVAQNCLLIFHFAPPILLFAQIAQVWIVFPLFDKSIPKNFQLQPNRGTKRQNTTAQLTLLAKCCIIK